MASRHAFTHLRRRAVDESGLTLVEMVIAATVFIVVATGLAGILASSITSHGDARDRTRAEEIAQDQIERIRKMSYSNVGTQSGNPPGQVPAAGFPGTVPALYTAAISIGYVTDPGPSSYYTSNYKKVVVTVTRARDGKRLALLTTFVAPQNRTQMGGLSSVGLTVLVSDYAINDAVDNAAVTVANGPSPASTDVTDATGRVVFANLQATDSHPPRNYYDITVAKAGYITFSGDLPPAPAAHITLAPSQTVTKTIRIFKPSTIQVALKTAANAAYTGAATVRVLSARTGVWTTFNVAAGGDGTLSVTSLGGEPVFPNVVYTVEASTSTGLCAQSAPTTVPDGYPTTTTTTFNLPLTTCASGTVVVNVKQMNRDVSNAAVTMTGGPTSISVNGTTDASGSVSFANVPSGSAPYTVTATRTVGVNTFTQSGTVTMSTGATANVALQLPNPSTANLTVNVTAGGSPLAGAQVTLTGAPFGESYSPLTTNASGQAVFSAVPHGSGYALTATKNGASGSASATVTAGGTTVTVPMASGSVTVNVTQNSAAATGASVTLSGGPLSTSQTLTATSGSVTFTGVAAGSGYTVSGSRNGQSATSTSFAVAAGATSTVNLTLPNASLGSVTVNVTWAGVAVNGATVRLVNAGLGYDQSRTTTAGTTTFTGVPAGSGFTATATSSGRSAQNTSVSVSNGGTTTITLQLPVQTLTVRVQRCTTYSCYYQAGNAKVELSGGPMSLATVIGTTNGYGNVVFSNVPVGTGYTIKAFAVPCTLYYTRTGVTLAGQTVNATATTITASYGDTTTCH